MFILQSIYVKLKYFGLVMTTGIFQIEGDFQKEISDEDDYEISENVSYFEK